MQPDAAAGSSSDSLARQLEAVELVDLMDVDLSSIDIGEQDELLRGFGLEQAKRMARQEASKNSPSKQGAQKESKRHRRIPFFLPLALPLSLPRSLCLSTLL